MIKIISVFGTRPDTIKMAPLVNLLNTDKEINHIVCITGQHREMVNEILDIFGITAKYDLDIMREGQSLEYVTSSVLMKFSEVLENEKPDMILVHGDTNTCFSAALAAFYKKVPIGHVEAGLRTADIYSPYPEEFVRRTVDSISTLFFSPTKNNADNLIKENVDKSRIYVTGNTVIDTLQTTVRKSYIFKEPLLNMIDYKTKKVIPITAHRRENIGINLENICNAVKKLASIYSESHFVYTVHPNPAVRNTVNKILDGIENVSLLPPLVFTDLHNLMSRAYFVMTDSGGLQEEAPSLGVPVLVLRKETERPEAVEAGTVRLTGVQFEDIVRDGQMLFDDKSAYDRMSNAVNPYGDGKASYRILNAIKEYFNNL
ncbi:MAG: UDP-N-acetylglucosamine 2-epimerase (non-hydrolyzing) [Clostridia bacterium]|jgi:UDP-N-acetylglucosamine 2-epimerase (non-hydrolysing)